MEFTYDAYRTLILLLKKHNYTFSNYFDYKKVSKPVILRHDVDMDIEKAYKLAELECEMGVKSTYFFLISSDFYNLFSNKNCKIISMLKKMGHDVGLHFDEAKYESENIIDDLKKEINIMSDMLGENIQCVSMHRPSKQTLEADYLIDDGKVINSYSKEFFEKFKYLSDSRRNWREDVIEIVQREQYSSLHILTHPFWYNEIECSAKESLKSFFNQRKALCYEALKSNIRDLDEFILKEEL